MGAGGNYQYPLGLGYISACLKRAGYDPRIVDLEVLGWDLARLSAFFLDKRPSLVGISTATPNYPYARQVISAARKALPDALLVMGGVHASALPEEVLAENPALDVVVIGEGEETMVELAALAAAGGASAGKLGGVNGLARRIKDKVERTPSRAPLDDLDSLPHPDRSAAPPHRYRPQAYADVGLPSASLITSRGCPYRCAFCASGVTMGKKFRAHSPGYIIEEMEQLQRDHGVRHFVFKDDTFTIDRERVEEFCHRLIKEKKGLSWFCYARPDRVDRELLALMRQAGLRIISFGLESGDDETLRELCKGSTAANGLEALSSARQEGLFAVASYILGAPGEDEKMIKATIDYARRGNPVLASFNRLVIYPGTPLYDGLPKGGWLSDNWEDYVPTGPRLAANLSKLSDKRLNELTRAAYRGFYLRAAKMFDIMRNVRGRRHLGVFIRAASGFLRQLSRWRK